MILIKLFNFFSDKYKVELIENLKITNLSQVETSFHLICKSLVFLFLVILLLCLKTYDLNKIIHFLFSDKYKVELIDNLKITNLSQVETSENCVFPSPPK